jgi:Na+-transporting NADH:ubiquinone oxidoreductase subunit B
MTIFNFQRPQKLFQLQKVMLRVCYALIPLVAAAIYLFGWRSFFLVLTSLIFGIITEALFNFRNNKPVTSAVFVTCLIFSLSLPPGLPFWMAAVGIISGLPSGKWSLADSDRIFSTLPWWVDALYMFPSPWK